MNEKTLQQLILEYLRYEFYPASVMEIQSALMSRRHITLNRGLLMEALDQLKKLSLIEESEGYPGYFKILRNDHYQVNLTKEEVKLIVKLLDEGVELKKKFKMILGE